jgi:hypothetical protein
VHENDFIATLGHRKRETLQKSTSLAYAATLAPLVYFTFSSSS